MTQFVWPVYSPPMMNGWQHNGAFVIKFRPETDVSSNIFYGRIEHVASHRQIRFETLEELLEFLYSTLTEIRAEFQRADTLADNLKQ
jgi:hypothetical protein